MGYAARHNRRQWASLWAARGWLRLRVCWLFLWQPRTRVALRGRFWRWLLRKPDVPTVAHRLDVMAEQIRDLAHLHAVLEAIPDPRQRNAVYDQLAARVKRRTR